MKKYKTALPELSLKYKTGEVKKIKIQSSQDAADFMRKLFDADTLQYKEEMIVLLLNKANNTIGFMKVSTGGMTGTLTDPRIIFSTALISGAVSIILAHNHPSGDYKPSNTDVSVTKKLKEGGKLLDVELLDHIIITADRYYSMLDEEELI